MLPKINKKGLAGEIFGLIVLIGIVLLIILIYFIYSLVLFYCFRLLQSYFLLLHRLLGPRRQPMRRQRFTSVTIHGQES